MKITVMGPGGVGGYFGARLAAAGNDVTFVARGSHLAAMRKGGLRLDSDVGKHGDTGLDRPAQYRMDLVDDMVRHELPLTTLADITARLAAYIDFQQYPDKAVEAVHRDLSAIVSAGGTPPTSSVRDAAVTPLLSPQSMVAVKSLKAATGLPSVKLATCPM